MNNQKKTCILDNLELIAHEFRTPLDIISKSAELVTNAQEKDIIEKEKLNVIMKGIINNCHRMSFLVSQIISISQTDANALKVFAEKSNISNFVEAVKKYLIQYEKRYQVKVEFKINIKNPIIITDFKKLETILLNLISNAVKYSKGRDRKIILKANESKDGNYIIFSVKDKGVGINSKEKEKIFQKFYRCENFRTRETEGSGLGLVVVKNFVELLNGKISVVSDVNKGSEFIVTIPRLQTSNSGPLKIVEPTAFGYTPYKTSFDEAFAAIREADEF